MQIMVFSKHLQGPPLASTARRLRAMGIDAIDLTVRPGGHVEPERVEDDLPAAIATLAAEGVSVGMLTTGIVSASDPHTEPILRIAAEHGIRFYKLGYFMYKGFGTLRAARTEARAQVRDLAQLSAAAGICGGFHNHSDNFIGASLWDVDYVLDGTDPKSMGSYLDPAHAVIEGGSGGWEMGMDLLKERIVMVAVKDFIWTEADGYAGGRRFHTRFCPLVDGNVPWPKVLRRLVRIGFSGPVSLHSEYQGAHSFRDLSTDEVFEQTARDAVVFNGWLREAREAGA